jgi:imidazolonepropionase-like amidohydrolase
MAVIFALLEEGEKFGLPPVSMDKLRGVFDYALKGLEIMHQAGVKMGLGTDLIGQIYTRQSSEFELRARVLPTIDILRSATAVNAELVCQEGKLGCVKEGAFADLLVVDGNPLKDISVLGGNGEKLSVVMNAGKLHKNTL